VTADAGGPDWADYYAAEAGRPPRPLLAAVLGRWQQAGNEPGFAIDLGCGDGADTFELLRQGWAVLAIDRQPAAIALAERNVSELDRSRLQTRVADFTALPLPAADLIDCGWSLPHCPAARFASTWHTIRAAIRPHGRIAAHLLGHRDDWALDPASSAFGRAALDTLLAGLDVEHLEEIEEDRNSFDGPKHWHYYEIIGRQPREPGARQRPAAQPRRSHTHRPNSHSRGG
jgi:SAM-dependent methyltransferase